MSYQQTKTGNNSGTIDVGVTVDYDFMACQCNPTSLECETSALSQGSVLHTCFTLVGNVADIVFAGVHQLHISKNGVLVRSPIMYNVPDGLTVMNNVGTPTMLVSTHLISSDFNLPIMNLTQSGMIILGFGTGSGTRRSMLVQPSSSGYWELGDRHQEPFRGARRLQQGSSSGGPEFQIEIMLEAAPEEEDKNSQVGLTNDSSSDNNNTTAITIGGAAIGLVVLSTLFFMVAVRRKFRKADEEFVEKLEKAELSKTASTTSSYESRFHSSLTDIQIE